MSELLEHTLLCQYLNKWPPYAGSRQYALGTRTHVKRRINDNCGIDQQHW
jgi:hypothetical protein